MANTHYWTLEPFLESDSVYYTCLVVQFCLQALLQGPRQTFKLPAAILEARNGGAPAGSGATSFKVRLPISKGSLAGQVSKPRSRPPASRTKPSGQSRYATSTHPQFADGVWYLCFGSVTSLVCLLLYLPKRACCIPDMQGSVLQGCVCR